MNVAGEKQNTKPQIGCSMIGPYLRVDPVLPSPLTGHERSDLVHALCGIQHPNIQLEKLLRVVVIGQNRDVHLGTAATSTLNA